MKQKLGSTKTPKLQNWLMCFKVSIKNEQDTKPSNIDREYYSHTVTERHEKIDRSRIMSH